MANNETTTKLSVDISALKKGLQDASRQIRLANSEFKAASAGMDNWSDSSAGLEAKLKQLDGVLDAEKKKLGILEAQYEAVAAEQGSTSKAAEDLRIKINNQRAAVGNAEKQIRTYSEKLEDIRTAAERAADAQEETLTSVDRLKAAISDQESALKQLKDEYANIVLEQGKESDAAKELAGRISELNDDLSDNQRQLDNASGAADDLAGATEDAGDKAEDASGGFTVLKGAIANLLADAISATIDGFKELATSGDTALNTLQSRTGLSTAEMGAFKDEMNELYKGNYGESLDDIAEAMATVAQNSSEADPSKIKDLTQNALLLRDAFGYDVNETMRAANMLMDQFGMTGDEAFNLIAQGSQNGLDKNGDLLDSINEYAVHYQQMGYSGEEFFNSLSNGTEAGTFSVDKLGDAMKEFGIRTKDTADSTTEGFQLVGLDADAMREKFASGGETAKQATEETLTALFSMDDQVKQNQAGVALFGTMWEDLGIDGVKALVDVNGEMDGTKATMAEIDAVKYDDVGSQLSELGRIIKTDILQPIVEQIMPAIRSGIDWITQNLPVVTALVVGLGTAFIAWKVVGIVMSVTRALQGMTIAQMAAAAAQKLLNLAMLANPLGIIIALVAGLVAAFVVLWNKSEKFREFWINLWEKIKEITSAVVGAIGDFFSGLWEKITGVFSAAGEWFSKTFDTVKNAVVNVFSPVIDFFRSVWDKIVQIFSPVVEFYIKLYSSVFNTIKSIFQNIIGIFQGCWEAIVLIFTPVVEWFKEKFSQAWEGIKAIWSAVTGFYRGIWEGIVKIFTPVAKWFSDAFSKAWSGITEAFSKVGGFFSDVWARIKKPFGDIAGWFKEKFSQAWQAVKDVFSTGGKIFDGIKDGILDGLKNVINGLIGGINKVIAVPFKGLNTALQKIKDISIFGEQPFADKISLIDIPEIPKLAKGGIVDGETFIAGERGKEAIVPLENNTGWLDEIASRLFGLLDEGGGGSATSISRNVTNNFYQTNTSPKALSRVEIYRQSKNLLSLRGAD